MKHPATRSSSPWPRCFRSIRDPYTKDLIVAALETGCRGELRSLQWQDIQDDMLVLTAEKTKTKRKRVIPISPTLRKVLDRRRNAPTRG